MGVQTTGAAERIAELEAQKARLLDPQPALDAADADLAEVRRQHPTWKTPGSWYMRFLARLERYVVHGRL